MKIGELTSFGHNVADSLASGLCSMVGLYFVDIFGEAAAAAEGHVTVDFVAGTTSGSPISLSLRQAVQGFAEMLPELARKHGIDPSDIRVLSARFGTDPAAGPHFAVTVATSDGRESFDRYAGFPGKRLSRRSRSRRAA